MTSSPYPYLTECFRNTVLQWIPLSMFWLILPVWIYILIKQRFKLDALPISSLFIAKQVNIKRKKKELLKIE